MQAAEKALEARRPTRPDEQKAIEAALKLHREEVQGLDKAVRQRLAKWKEMCAALPTGKASGAEIALKKADMAYNETFVEMMGNQQVRSPIGLGKKAYEILSDIKPESIPEKLRAVDLQMRYRLLMAMGRADEVMKSLKTEDMKKNLPVELYATNLLVAGAALGDYDAMEEALAAIEKNMKQGMKSAHSGVEIATAALAPELLVIPQIGSAGALATAATLQALMPLAQIQGMRIELEGLHNELGNAVTLRGIVALEAGNTEFARTLFKRALDEAGDTHFFTERAIARRYLELLNEQKR
jgi:tetratricopeptide (TPR) repeat protein